MRSISRKMSVIVPINRAVVIVIILVLLSGVASGLIATAE